MRILGIAIIHWKTLQSLILENQRKQEKINSLLEKNILLRELLSEYNCLEKEREKIKKETWDEARQYYLKILDS